MDQVDINVQLLIICLLYLLWRIRIFCTYVKRNKRKCCSFPRGSKLSDALFFNMHLHLFFKILSEFVQEKAHLHVP